MSVLSPVLPSPATSGPARSHPLEAPVDSEPSFADLGVPAELVARLEARGLTSPFPIQRATIPDALAGRDVCGRAPTGSGKTLAFGLVVVARAVGAKSRRPAGLVLVPTRELAAQVQRELAALSGDRGRRVVAVYGGTGYGEAQRSLNRGVDVLVACPGRLEDLVARGAVDLSGVRVVVLDEADRMVDMGFLPAVRRLLDLTPTDRQMLLFSATLGREVETLAQRYQRNPVRHDVGDDEPADVTHHFWSSARERRLEVTARLVREHGRALVFCKTRRGADRVARQLSSAGVSAAPIHGDRTQAQRERALAAFAAQQTQALVATDVAARGIHVDELPCVVHFDPPNDATDYLHRSGRTGRAGNVGTVVSLVTEDQHRAARGLQRALGLPEGIDAVPAHTTAGSGSRQQAPKAPRNPVGVISFLNAARGFGFISREGGDDLFVHHTNVAGGGFPSLVSGQRVEFVVAEGRRGPEARDVKAL